MRNVQQEKVATPAVSRALLLHISWPWWVHPSWALLLMTGVTAGISILLPESVYEVWRTPKFLEDELPIVLLLGILMVFSGAIVASAASSRKGVNVIRFDEKQVCYLRRAYAGLFFLALVGYTLWIASALSQGVDLADLRAVVARESGAIGDLKSNGRPIAGLTTLTQFGPVAAVIGALLHKLGVGRRSYLWLVALSCVRTLFYAERLAFFEMVIPLVLFAAFTIAPHSKWRKPVQLAPLLMAPVIWAVFAISEYTRSWVYYQQATNLPFVEWVTVRLLGYYTTAFNHSALFVRAHEGSGAPPYFSVGAFWEAPGMSAILPHPGIRAYTPGDWWGRTLQSFSNPEFNNVGSFLITYAEFGLLLMLTFWFLVGFLLGRVFVSLANGSVIGLFAYANLFIGILELPRFIYWSQGRASPILLALVVVALTYPRASKASGIPTPSDRRHGADATSSYFGRALIG